MTKKDRDALVKLAELDQLIISNKTNLDRGVIYWQTADRLRSMGYAREMAFGSTLKITDAGARKAKELAA